MDSTAVSGTVGLGSIPSGCTANIFLMKSDHMLATLICLTLALSGCGKKEINIDQLDFRDNNVYLKNSQTPFTGSAFVFYKNGQKFQERIFNGGKATGLIMWHTNGKKSSVITIHKGDKYSFSYWDRNGTPVDSLDESALTDSLNNVFVE